MDWNFLIKYLAAEPNLYLIEFFDAYYETYVREIVGNTQIEPFFECGNYIKIFNENNIYIVL
jgi:hypothetical protein